jgi:hypothetical protein
MRWIWMGAEAPNDVDLLYGHGVRDMGVSLSSFRRRVKSPQNNLDRFADDVHLYLYDSEAWNTEADVETLAEGADAYEKFLHQWYGKFRAFTEFDAPALGKEYILERRDDFYDDDRFDEQFWPTWHPVFELDHLKYLGEAYTDVVIPVGALTPTVTNVLGTLKREYQTSFHLMGFSLDESIRYELFEDVFMSTWSSALRHQDIYVPKGNWVQRVPKDEQKAQLKRHSKFVEEMGCDVQMLIDGNNSERELYTVRVFRWLENHSAIVDLLSGSSESAPVQAPRASLALVSDSDVQDERQSGRPNTVQALSETTSAPLLNNGTLPGMSVEAQTAFTTDADGHMTIAEIPVVRRSVEPIRSCDSCSLSSNCPAFTPAAQCKFLIPVQIRTREQMAAVTEAMLEMQAARVFFAQFAEETSGYHDPTVGKEMDRFAKLASMFAKLGESKETIKVEASRTTQGGVLSNIFGRAPKTDEG